MLKQYFSHKLEAGELHLNGTGLMVSSKLNPLEVAEKINVLLKEVNLVADTNSLLYLVKDSHLYVEGWAFEIPKSQTYCFMVTD